MLSFVCNWYIHVHWYSLHIDNKELDNEQWLIGVSVSIQFNPIFSKWSKWNMLQCLIKVAMSIKEVTSNSNQDSGGRKFLRPWRKVNTQQLLKSCCIWVLSKSVTTRTRCPLRLINWLVVSLSWCSFYIKAPVNLVNAAASDVELGYVAHKHDWRRWSSRVICNVIVNFVLVKRPAIWPAIICQSLWQVQRIKQLSCQQGKT